MVVVVVVVVVDVFVWDRYAHGIDRLAQLSRVPHVVSLGRQLSLVFFFPFFFFFSLSLSLSVTLPLGTE